MSHMVTHSAFKAAERLGPAPTTREEATTQAWVRHYAARALAAHAEFRHALGTLGPSPEPDSRPDLGYLIAIATTATAATCALVSTSAPDVLAEELWDLKPEGGALNGEYIDYLAGVVAGLGINPAELYPWFAADDFATEVAR